MGSVLLPHEPLGEYGNGLKVYSCFSEHYEYMSIGTLIYTLCTEVKRFYLNSSMVHDLNAKTFIANTPCISESRLRTWHRWARQEGVDLGRRKPALVDLFMYW